MSKMFRVHWGQLSREQRATWERLGCPHEVPWVLLAPHEAQAQNNHAQSLERLHERGGLSPAEMVYIIEDRKWERPFMTDEEAIPKLIEYARLPYVLTCASCKQTFGRVNTLIDAEAQICPLCLTKSGVS